MGTKKSFLLVLGALASMAMHFACQKEEMPQPALFQGTFATTNEVLNPAPELRQRITGIAQDKSLGINKFVAVATVTIAPPPPFKLSGECTFYAEDGDTFATTFTGTNTPNAEGIFVVEMTHTIVGGTGKFAEATGTFVGNATADPRTLKGSITYRGTITY
jgi:hypothetical protein